MNRTVAVIGAGLGGLAAAARLARQGCRVHVFERTDGPGGKAGSVSRNGFRFDTGPSLLTMEWVFRELFEFCGMRREDRLGLLPLDPVCHYFYPGGERIAAPGKVSHFIRRFEERGLAASGELERFFRHAERIYRITGHLFLEKSLHEWSTYLRWETLRSLLSLGRIDAGRTMERALERFFKDPRLVQFFGRYATYNGSRPDAVPATLNLIPWVEYGLGAWAVQGGIHAVPLALESLARDLGVEFHYGQGVRTILRSGRRVTGLVTGGQRLDCDAVLSNADVGATYELLDDHQAPWARRYRRLTSSSSGVVFYWGVGRAFDELGLHNVFFSPDYPAEFRDIFDEGRCPRDPTVYVNITSKTEPADAPAGCENWFVLVNAPPDTGQDWDSEKLRLRRAVLGRIESALGQSLEPWITTEKIAAPPDLAKATGSVGGSLYGPGSHSWRAAFSRHPNRSRRWKGLYFCGGTVHPGGGMPLVLLSAKIATELLMKHEFPDKTLPSGRGARP